MAYDILRSNSPQSLANAESMLEVLSNNDPSITANEGEYPFVECATFADYIKGHGGRWQENWHFVDIPYFD